MIIMRYGYSSRQTSVQFRMVSSPTFLLSHKKPFDHLLHMVMYHMRARARVCESNGKIRYPKQAVFLT